MPPRRRTAQSIYFILGMGAGGAMSRLWPSEVSTLSSALTLAACAVLYAIFFWRDPD